MKNIAVKIFSIIILLLGFVSTQGQGLKVLILSGRNNHDWKTTTPFLQKLYEKSGLFEVRISEKPEELKTEDFEDINVVVSNWSSFPDREYRWPAQAEEALIDFINRGGGFVTLHAATTAFYEWPEFKQITTGAWVEETKHGKKCVADVSILNSKHPITKGMADFCTFEELWMNAEQNPKFEVLASAKNENTVNAGLNKQAVAMVREYGKGRIFHTTLGHEVRNMRNTGFQTLILRGTEWAASGKVKQKLPQELKVKAEVKVRYKWIETDTTFTLLNGKEVVWQYNFREFHQKPHFHPVFIGRNNITCVSPDDHIWHVGQWFSWKYINDVNYWEYVNNKEYRSEGTTEIKNIKLKPNSDFSADIELEIVYHPAGGEDVLIETRKIHVWAPNSNGELTMDYSFSFKALDEFVELNRTPTENEPNGKSWGGYGGLSLRFNQSFMNLKTFNSWKGEKEHAERGTWFFMGFTGLDGNKIGSQMIVAPNTLRDEAAWYVTKNDKLPFYYYGPAYLFNKPVSLQKGEKLQLNYRINHYAGPVDYEKLQKASVEYQNQFKL